jgi:2-methylcitrate dehydratase PrpD
VLAAVLAVGEKENISGRDLLLAYVLGVEVECRIADAIHPRHYQSGFHSTATMGGLGAAMAVGKISDSRKSNFFVLWASPPAWLRVYAKTSAP